MTSMTSETPEFPESFAAVLQRLSLALEELRRLRAADGTGLSASEQALTSWILQVQLGAQGLKAGGRPTLARVLEGCAAAGERLQAVPALQGQEALEAIERALAAVLQHAEHPLADAVGQAVELFPLHRAVQHLAGADRVHPADLWPGCTEWRELPADPFTPPRAVDAAAREALEAALLALMRKPRAEDFQRMSELCAGLGEGTLPPQASVWRLASAVYEAQSEGRLAPDVYLKRLGPRLLAMTRQTSPGVTPADRSVLEPAAPAPGTGQLSEPVRTLAHELLFFCHRALAADASDGSPAGPRLARFIAAYGPADTQRVGMGAEPALRGPEAVEACPAPEAPETAKAPEAPPALEPPALELAVLEAVSPELVSPEPAASAAQRSLADAVPGLPSAADLDFSSWSMAANADVAAVPDDEVKVIGTLRLEIPAFNAFLNDADEASRRLTTVLAEWALEPAEPVPDEAVALAAALARGAAQVGHVALAALADALVHTLQAMVASASASSAEAQRRGDPTHSQSLALTTGEATDRLLMAAEEIRRVLHQFAAGFLTEPAPRVLQRLVEITHVTPQSIGPNDLRYLQEAARLQAGVTRALDRLAAFRPSLVAASVDPAESDRDFDAVWTAAVADLKASQQLLESLHVKGEPSSDR